MRYMVFGDVHGNLVALEAALAAAEQLGATAYLFVGDAVGYGPQPLECVERLRALHEQEHLAWVAGNHELVVRDELDLEGCNDEAQATLNWTRGLVKKNRSARKFIATAPLTLQVNEGIWLAHDSVGFPGNGRYHHLPRQAESEIACLRHFGGRVCFYGHTHKLRAEVFRDNRIWLLPMLPAEPPARDPKPVTLADGEIGWIGVGSAGLSTSPGRPAEFLILDDDDPAEWKVECYAVPYSRDEARTRTREVLAGPCGEAVADQIARWM